MLSGDYRVSNSVDYAATESGEQSVETLDKQRSGARHWLIAIAAVGYLLLLLTPIPLLLRDHAAHGVLADYLEAEDRWLVYRTKMEYASLLNALYRAESGDPRVDVDNLQLLIDVLHNRVGILSSDSPATEGLRGVPEYEFAVDALRETLNAADQILAQEPGTAVSPAVSAALAREFGAVEEKMDAMIEAIVARSVKNRDMYRTKIQQGESLSSAALIALIAATSLFIGALIWNNRQSDKSRRRLVRLAERLQRSESRLNAFMRHAPVAMSVKDLDGRYLMVNRLAEEFHGRPIAEILGRTSSELGSGTTAHTAIVEEMERAAIETSSTHSRQVCRNGGETPTWFVLVKFPIQNGEGKVVAVGGIGLDITDLKETQERMAEAMKQAEAANRAKSEFLANASHELRTPLNAILGFGEIIEGEMFGTVGHSRYKEYAGDIVQSGRYLLNIVDDLLDLSKIEFGAFELNESRCNPADIMAAAAHLVEASARQKGLAFEVDAATPLVDVFADRRVLIQVFVNLLTNAIKFTGTGGKVSFACRSTDDAGLEFEVADTGIGIAEHDMADILQPFARADDPHVRNLDGTGLGLSIAKSMVDRHGGTLDVTSRVGVGTRMVARFPASRIMSASEGPAPIKQAAHDSNVPGANRHVSG